MQWYLWMTWNKSLKIVIRNLSDGGNTYKIFYVIAAWSKRTRIVFTVSELLPSHNKIYRHGRRHFCQEKNNQLLTDLYVKPTDKDQYLHASFCYVYYSNKSMPYSQVVRLNRIFSENSYYDKRCNELVVWLRGL